MASSPAPRVPDLHKSAFWIYGVTAMVMREPLSIVLRHSTTAGWRDPAVQLEAVRALIVLGLLSRQFLAAGIFFDRVYLQPEAAERFPRRSYPVDFLFGMGELLLAVGASTVVGTASPTFNVIVAVVLLSEGAWLLVARLLEHSTVPKIAPGAVFNLLILAMWVPLTALFGDFAGSLALIALTAVHMVRLGRTYDEP
ncbi:MAG: hypothetical protein JWN34_3577 [Bryobacterales bacterium]|nr:hypothetical protein [Bryobacterales bacterium]